MKEIKYEDMAFDFGDIVKYDGNFVGKIVGKHSKRDGTYEYSINKNSKTIHNIKPDKLKLVEKTNKIY